MSVLGSLLYALRTCCIPACLADALAGARALVLWSTLAFFLLGWIMARLAAQPSISFFATPFFFLTLDCHDWALMAEVLVYLAFIPLVYMTR